MADYGSMFVAEELRLDGSNFIEWYQRLREVLATNDQLYVLHEPLEEKPQDSASYNKRMAWLDRSKTHVQGSLLSSRPVASAAPPAQARRPESLAPPPRQLLARVQPWLRLDAGSLARQLFLGPLDPLLVVVWGPIFAHRGRHGGAPSVHHRTLLFLFPASCCTSPTQRQR